MSPDAVPQIKKQESSWLPNRFCCFVIVGTSIDSEHNHEILAENEWIAWAAA
jgi:hypothetical protein